MGLDRRSFISFLAGGTGGILFTPVVWKFLDDASIWSQNWPWIPRLQYGPLKRKPALCKLGPDAYGVEVETVSGRPVTAYGNSKDPVSKGGICPLGAAAVQMLHSPARVKSPMKREGNSLVPVSWEEALALLKGRLQAAGSDVAMISGDESGTAAEVLAGLVAASGSNKYFFMPSESGPAVRAWQKVFGGEGQPGYDFENSDCILSLGADICATWGPGAGRACMKAKEAGAAFVYAGPVENGTAAVADSWVPCIPGTEAVLALGIAGALIDAGQARTVAGSDEFSQYVHTHFPPAQVEAKTGVKVAKIKELARRLADARRPLAVIGSESGQGLSTFEAAAGMALNMLLGRINQKGGLRIIPWADPVVSGAPRRDEVLDNDLVAYLVNVAASREKAPAVMLVHDANPAYALPGAAAMSEVLRKSAFLVSFSPFMDETAAMADLVLPSSYAFEAFDDSYTPFGGPLASYRAAAPIIEPVHDTRPMPDVLLGLASELGFDLGHSSFEEVIQARAEQLGADFSALTEEGETWVSEGSAFQFFLSLWKEPMSADLGRTQAGGQLVLAPVTRLNIGSPGTATPPFNVLTISERELQGRECFVAMNRATASMLKVGQGDKVRISSQAGAMEARVRLFEGVAPGAVSASLGFGHTAWDEFSQGKGANAFDLFTVQGTDALGGTAFGNPQISVSRV